MLIYALTLDPNARPETMAFLWAPRLGGFWVIIQITFWVLKRHKRKKKPGKVHLYYHNSTGLSYLLYSWDREKTPSEKSTNIQARGNSLNGKSKGTWIKLSHWSRIKMFKSLYLCVLQWQWQYSTCKTTQKYKFCLW